MSLRQWDNVWFRKCEVCAARCACDSFRIDFNWFHFSDAISRRITIGWQFSMNRIRWTLHAPLNAICVTPITNFWTWTFADSAILINSDWFLRLKRLKSGKCFSWTSIESVLKLLISNWLWHVFWGRRTRSLRLNFAVCIKTLTIKMYQIERCNFALTHNNIECVLMNGRRV